MVGATEKVGRGLGEKDEFISGLAVGPVWVLSGRGLTVSAPVLDNRAVIPKYDKRAIIIPIAETIAVFLFTVISPKN